MVALKPNRVFEGDTLTCVLCGLVHHVRKGNFPGRWRAMEVTAPSGRQQLYFVCPAHLGQDDKSDEGWQHLAKSVMAKIGLPAVEFDFEHD